MLKFTFRVFDEMNSNWRLESALLNSEEDLEKLEAWFCSREFFWDRESGECWLN